MKKIFKNYLVSSLILVCILMFLGLRGWLNYPKNLLLCAISPLQKMVYSSSLSVGRFFSFFTSQSELIEENSRLRENNKKLLSEAVRFKEAEAENNFLRRQMGLSLTDEGNLILADVIGQNSSNFERSFFIDEGEESGIRNGAVVIEAGNFLIGRITEVFDNFAKAYLLTDQRSQISVEIQGRSVNGLLRGDGAGGLIIDLLGQGGEMKTGEAVITSGLAGVFPRGLLVGRIREVILSDTQTSQKATVVPMTDFDNLKKVFVFRNPLPEIGLSEADDNDQ